MSTELTLPRAGGTLMKYRPGPPSELRAPARPFHSRIVYSAAHVVCDPLADTDPITQPRIDWEATLAYRRYLWTLGLAVAEAMDTAQRGMGLDWATTKELIGHSLPEARAAGGRIACGAGTDQLAPRADVTLAEVTAAYEEQCSFIENAGGRIILMASRALARCATSPDDYVQVYSRIL